MKRVVVAEDDVHEPGHEPVKQLALSDDDDRLLLGPLRHVAEPRSGLAAPDQADEEKRPATEQCAGDHERCRQGDRGDEVHLCLRISAEIAGTISFRSPVTV